MLVKLGSDHGSPPHGGNTSNCVFRLPGLQECPRSCRIVTARTQNHEIDVLATDMGNTNNREQTAQDAAFNMCATLSGDHADNTNSDPDLEETRFYAERRVESVEVKHLLLPAELVDLDRF